MISRHVSVWVDADWEGVYAIASDQRRLPEWAAGLADPALEFEVVKFAPTNAFGVVDHRVRLPGGDEVFNPMRVIPSAAGESGCEVVFTLRRRAEQTEATFEDDVAAVTADLTTLKRLAEAESAEVEGSAKRTG
jgi:hypothetical protein